MARRRHRRPRAELCGLRWRRIDPGARIVHIAPNYVVTSAMLHGFKDKTAAALPAADVTLAGDAFVFSNDGGATPWNPNWITHRVANAADAAGVAVNIKSLRHLHRHPSARGRPHLPPRPRPVILGRVPGTPC